MSYKQIDVALGILDFLKDAEYHSITATVLGVGKYLNLSSAQMSEVLPSRKTSDTKTFTSTKIYVETVLVVSSLRKLKFLKDFPKTSKLGFFTITEKGLELYKKNKNDIKKILNEKLNITKKPRKTRKN